MREKTEMIRVRVSPEEKETITRLARYLGKTNPIEFDGSVSQMFRKDALLTFSELEHEIQKEGI